MIWKNMLIVFCFSWLKSIIEHRIILTTKLTGHVQKKMYLYWEFALSTFSFSTWNQYLYFNNNDSKMKKIYILFLKTLKSRSSISLLHNTSLLEWQFVSVTWYHGLYFNQFIWCLVYISDAPYISPHSHPHS